MHFAEEPLKKLLSLLIPLTRASPLAKEIVQLLSRIMAGV